MGGIALLILVVLSSVIWISAEHNKLAKSSSEDLVRAGNYLNALLKEQFGLRMQKATQQLTNTAKLKDVRRSIARVRTLMNRKAGEA